MSEPLDYGRRRSRRHWRVLAVALILGALAYFAVRAWRQHRAYLEDRRLMAEQRRFREDFDRQFQRQLGPPPTPATTRP